MNLQRIGEQIPIIGTLDPVTVVNSEVFTDVIDMSKFDEVTAYALLGNMSNETIDFKAYYCDDAGSNAGALKAATQLAASASANDGGQIVISVLGQDLLDISQTARYIKFGIVTGNSSGGPAAILVLGVPNHGFASANDLSTVKEIKL